MSSKAFARQIFQFLYQVNESRTLDAPVDVRVAIQLTRHFNEREGGRGRAGLEHIGKAIGVGKATVHLSIFIDCTGMGTSACSGDRRAAGTPPNTGWQPGTRGPLR